jgi:hypothetical protein
MCGSPSKMRLAVIWLAACAWPGQTSRLDTPCPVGEGKAHQSDCTRTDCRTAVQKYLAWTEGPPIRPRSVSACRGLTLLCPCTAVRL